MEAMPFCAGHTGDGKNGTKDLAGQKGDDGGMRK